LKKHAIVLFPWDSRFHPSPSAWGQAES
jgi:hypothetical protein